MDPEGELAAAMFKRLLLLLLLLLPTQAQEPRVFVTARDTGQRLTEIDPPDWQVMLQPEERQNVVFVDPTRKFQFIEGIGGALTDASAETFAKLPADKQDELISAYFDPEKGIGYTLARTHINSCDFSSSSYAYVQEGDGELKTFSIDPDRKFRIPFILRALKANPQLKIFASPWSPPAFMKTNNHMLRGGKLKPEFAASWANYYVRFIQEYRKAGIPIWGLTVQNEPMAVQTWESCIYTAIEELEFVRDHLGPTLEKAGLTDLKLMIWDHNRAMAYMRGATVFQDPEARRYVWGLAYHWYDGDQFENLSTLRDAYPSKALLFSEGCAYPFSWETINDWKWGETYGHSMINDFNHWCRGWTDWNVLLDEVGGPNHVANYCFAPVHADTRKGTLTYMNSYYYIGHFSKFVRPEARRIACTSMRLEIQATAFVNADNSVVTVLMNRTDKPVELFLWTEFWSQIPAFVLGPKGLPKGGRALPLSLPAHSIMTVTW